MSVAEQIGLHDQGSTTGLLTLAGQRWTQWTSQDPRLAIVDTLPQLRDWLRGADPSEADQALHVLATLAAVDGGNDHAAAAALCWALLPGACALAHRLRTLSPRIDEVVAAQLWVEVRTFPWKRVTKVASYILVNARVEVLRECGARTQTERVDRTWSNTSPVDPDGPFWAGYVAAWNEPEPTAADELLDVLEWACQSHVITAADRLLLLCLVEAADRATTTRLGRGAGGLLANDVSGAVAGQWGISPVTVRRRARRSMRALTQACGGADLPIPA